jgi:hypothetical protein
MMNNDFVELVNPDAVQADAVRLAARGEAVDAQTQSRLGAIEGIEAEAPWGSDQFGTGFLAHYHQNVGGQQNLPLDQAAKDGLRDLGGKATEIGDAVTTAVLGYTTADGTAAGDINSVR